MRSAAAAGPSGVVVPKINSAADVAAVERLLESAGAPDHTDDLGDARDAGGDRARCRDRNGLGAPDGADHGHQRPGQGAARGAGTGSASAAVGSGALRERGPVRRQGDPRRCLQRRAQPRRVRRRGRPGRGAGLRRQDPGASHPGRTGQRRVRSRRGRDRALATRHRRVRGRRRRGQGRGHRGRQDDREPPRRQRRRALAMDDAIRALADG